MPYAIVALGGNLGDPEATVKEVAEEMRSWGSKYRCSSLYKTEPVSPIPQPWYVNAVCGFETALSPAELFQALEKLETRYGKKSKTKEAPRVIDLDLLFYGSEVYEKEGYQVPHPRWKERLFVLVPLSEIAEEIIVGETRFNVPKMIASKGSEACTKCLLKIS